MIALIGGIAIGFLLGALIAPKMTRGFEERMSPSRPQKTAGSTSFTGPMGAEGGGFDGEPLE